MAYREWSQFARAGMILAAMAGSGAASAQGVRDLLNSLLPSPRQVQQAQREAEEKRADEKCRALVDWAGSVPGSNSNVQAQPGGDPHPAHRLFADAAFKPVFGKNYDELSPSERVQIHNERFVACQRSRVFGPAVQQLSVTLALPFQGSWAPGMGARIPALSTEQVTEAVRRFRTASAGVRNQLGELAALPPDARSWAAFTARRPLIEAAMRWQPAAEQSATQAGLAQVGRRLATAALAATQGQAMTLPDAASSLAPLRAATDQLREFEEFVPGPEVQAARSALQNRREAVLRRAVAAERTRWQSLGNSVAALPAGAAWYQEMQTRYDDETRREAAFTALLADFRSQRDVQLATGQPAWASQLRASIGSAEVAGVLASVLRVPGDAESAAGQALRQVALAREEGIRTEAAALLAANAAAAERALGPVGLCDKRAAHPDDPEALSAGVRDEAVEAGPAIQACEAAVKQEPQSPRLAFQLARAYLKADRVEDATEQLLAAAKGGHGGAMAYLADLHVDGAPGIEADPLLARQLYEKAVAAGFTPAEAVLKDYEDRTAEVEAAMREEQALMNAPPAARAAPKAYAMPRIIEGIQTRKFSTIGYPEAWVKEYLYFVADNIRAICEGGFTVAEVERLKAASAADPLNLGPSALRMAGNQGINALGSVMQNPMAALQTAMAAREVVMRERQEADALEAGVEGMGDAFDPSLADTGALLERQGCSGPAFTKFNRNLMAFVLDEEAPATGPGEIAKACERDPLPTKAGSERSFCDCFLRGLRYARVSQTHRHMLTRSFKAGATQLMAIDSNKIAFRACRGD